MNEVHYDYDDWVWGFLEEGKKCECTSSIVLHQFRAYPSGSSR